jgi:parallel beta-helix repeat protein
VTHGLAQLRAGGTLYLRGGTYVEPLFEQNFGGSGSSWSNYVTVAAYPGETVTVQVVPGGDNAVRFQDSSVSYVEIDGLIIDGTGGGDRSTLVYLGPASHHVRFKNVEIRNSQGNGMLAGGSSHEFLNLNVHRNGLWDGYLNSNGMYMTTSNSVIDGGDFYNNQAFGVRFFNSDPAQSANNNTVRNARIYSNGLGVGVDGLSATTSGGGGIVLGDANNLAQDNQVYGNYEGIVVFGFKPSSGAKIEHNTVHDNVGLGIEIQSGAVNADVRNNTVYSNSVNILNSGAGTTLVGNGP